VLNISGNKVDVLINDTQIDNVEGEARATRTRSRATPMFMPHRQFSV